MRNPRLVLCAFALGVVLTLLFSTAARAAAPEPSATIAPGAVASFSIAGFSLSSSQSAPTSVQVAANPTAFANGATWRNIVYYAVDWGLINSDPASVQAALWYVSSGAWPAGDHSTAQRLVDTARSSATPASTANGYDLLSAISGGRASAVASFSSGSGSVTVTNQQFTALTVYLPYGAILSGPDGLPAYVVYATGSNGNPSAQPSATPAVPPTATAAAGLPTAPPTVAGGQPSATPTNATSGQPTATATMTATLQPKPTATVHSADNAASAGNTDTPTAPLNPTSTSSPSIATPVATATALPTNTPTLAPPATKPASPTAVPPAKPAIESVSGQSQVAQIVPTPISTVDDSLATAIPTGGTGLPTDVATIIFPTFTLPASGLTPSPIPSATSFFPPTATAAFATPFIHPVPTRGPPPGFSKPTPVTSLARPTPTLPTLPNEAPPGATVIPPGGKGTATGGSVTGTGKPPGIAPTTGEQSSWPLYLLIFGIAALVIGVVVIRMGNRAAKK